MDEEDKTVPELMDTSGSEKSLTETPTRDDEESSGQAETQSKEQTDKEPEKKSTIKFKISKISVLEQKRQQAELRKEVPITASNLPKPDQVKSEKTDNKPSQEESSKKVIAKPSPKKKRKPPKEINSDDPEEDTSEEEESDDEQEQKETPKQSETPKYDPANVHYEGEVAIYTDPKSGYQYQWSSETNEWKPKENITYGFEDDTHTYTDAQGVKYFWDREKNAWFPKIDDDFMARYQMSYGFVDNTTPAEKPKEEEEKKEPEKKAEKKDLKRKAAVQEPSWFEVNDQQNTKVYVSNLPTDITEEEFVDLMQKCGLVMRDMATGKMKIKLYVVPGTDILKGDALCTYIKIESVELALNVLDGYLYRGRRIKVERAKFELKGTYDPSLKPKKKKKKEKEKLKKMQEKLFDWRPDKLRGERAKHERIVIIKNLFEPSLFDTDVGLILEYQQDLREECSKCGDVRKVILFDRHPEGVAQINMKEPEEADACVALLNGRWFGQRKITAEIWDGKTKYKIAETDAQISQRLNEWDRFLETDEATKEGPAKKPKTEEEAKEEKKEDKPKQE